MPTVVIDLKTAEDPRDVVHRSVQALAEGNLVVFPTETMYGVAASGLNLSAVRRLHGLVESHGLDGIQLVVKGADDALDYVPGMSPLARRLSRRCWPGPMTLNMPVNHPESVVSQLPAEIREILAPGGEVGLRVPFHDVILSVMRLTIGPLALASYLPANGPAPVCGEEVASALEGDVDLILNAGRTKYGQPATIVAVNENHWEIQRPGVVSDQAIQRLSAMLILVVCTGNTCRSPMAELLLKKRIAEELGCGIDELDGQGIEVASAGIAAMAGGRPSIEAVKVLNERGLDLSGHLSQPLTERLARHADLILTMTNGHRHEIVSQWPDLANRTLVLSRDQGDISDPIGGPLNIYEKCANQIDEQLAGWVEELDLRKSAEK